jgi:hypothetical protein
MRRAVAAVGRLPDPVWAVAGLLVVVLFCLLHWCGPWLNRAIAPIEATPVPPARTAPPTVSVASGRVACIAGVEIPSQTRAIVLAGSVPGPGDRPPPVTVTAEGGGWSARATVAAGWPGGLAAGVHGPPRTLTGRVCLRNDGRVPFVLNANPEPGVTTATSTVQGRPVPAPISVTMVGAPTTRLDYLGTMLHRAASLTWRPFADWSAKLLAALVVLLTCGGSVGALVWTMRADARAEPEADHDLP